MAFGSFSGLKDHSINILINNHFDYYSNTAFYISGFKKPMNQNHLTGSIIINNPVWKYNKDALVFRNAKTMQFAPNIEFDNVKVFKKDQYGNDSIQGHALYKIIKSFSAYKRVKFY
jgi:hypothetical protein